MNSLEIIKKKRDRSALTADEIRFMVDGYTAGEIPDYQISALLMAVLINGMDTAETQALTEAMLHSGDVLDFSDIPGVKVDKHSTGGVGDKTSLILGPIAAAAGVRVPMISGRGLGHTGGTLDKLEAIPGFDVNLSVERFREGVERIGLCLIGQTARIAPADKKIYALRDVTGTVESIPLITASIMSKKLAEGIDALVLDVKTGRGAFMKTLDDSRRLARSLVDTGLRVGKRMSALITDMNQPLGRWAGNAVEVAESVATLRGEGPADLESLSVELAAEMIRLAGLAPDIDAARGVARRQIATGRALEVFARCIEFHGGDPRVTESDQYLPRAAQRHVVTAPQAGWVAQLDAEAVGMAIVVLGGGRLRKEDGIDPAVGVRLHRKIGDRVETGEPLAEIQYNDAARFDDARRRVETAYAIAEAPVAAPVLIRERLE
ncbi:MAG TPA: thymidine phosphorylase [Acidobacteriota bacterium]|nr:thymidine phosphorylase [Acidobacteriota bacterium]HOT00077.1 thymidine phosphorylase [Acidobacteriota bacterium]HQF85623.1 thymidine phosphorylase [Acidobacteriota bacterium]HQG91133.1 thymidine phosphorylase [Acidobacteriota bacterium]HQK88130.1 thymidine phosphorylase [Acidobacteriota bacterium]